jgi:hypothetical protein
MEYLEFLESKKSRFLESGFDCELLNPLLFDFQKRCVTKALKKARFALFEGCGLGKTFQQLEWAFRVVNYTNGNVLILAPLAVVQQTINEAAHFGISLNNITITNYEQIDNLNPSDYTGIVLDESSILKNYEGAIRNKIIDGFKDTPFKLACTATPSPNDPMELGNHSEFLNVMPRNEMLAMFFVHDGGETAKWRLKGHCAQAFYDWVSEWAIMMNHPRDIGFNADGYDLPGLNYIENKIITQQRDNGLLFNTMAISATNFNQELRFTKIDRLEQVVEIANGSDDQFLISVKQNEEGEYLRKLINGCFEVTGADTDEWKKDKLLGFADNKFRVMISKAKIMQFGMNYQNCHNIIIASPDFSFESMYQFIRRCYRFGQKEVVNVYIITTDTMSNVISSLRKKEDNHIKMQNAMTKSINKNLTQKVKLVRNNEIVTGDNFKLILGDSVQTIKTIPDESIGFSIFSPPFAELYTYSDELEDMGNSKDYKEFMFAFNFLVKDIYRILWSGRNVAVHCMDLPIQKGKEGYIGLRDFSGMILQAFTDAGFIYHSRVTLWKNPVTEMTRTKALGLLHKQIKKDAAMSRVGIPDYLMVFRKPGEHVHPVIHQDKDSFAPGYLPVDMWQKIASPVWMDINYGNTLNGKSARDARDEKHICPLQLDTIERSLHLWTNKGDTIYTPFAGIGSELYKSIQMGRLAIGGELKKSYFDVAVKNCKNAELANGQTLMFS